MARRQRQRRCGRIGRGDHLVVARRHDLLSGDPIDEAPGQGGDDDLVAVLELVDVEEWLPERGAVTGDGRIAELSGHRGFWIVSRAVLQIVLLDTRDHPLADTDPRYLDPTDRVAFADRRQVGGLCGGRRRCGRVGHRFIGSSVGRWRRVDWARRHWRQGGGGRCGRRRSEEFLELAAQRILGASGLDAGTPELVGDEPEQQQPGGDQCLAEATDPPTPVVRWSGSVELSHPLRARHWWFDVGHGTETTCALRCSERGPRS